MASVPTYDPNVFIGGVSQSELDALPDGVFNNFALQGEYAPASTFKAVPYARKETPVLAGMMYSLQVAPEDCTGCGLCVEACPFGAVFYSPDKSLVLKCDLCGGMPQCVRFCRTGALLYSTGKQGETG